MAMASRSSESLRCPACGNTTLAEFYEPAGVAIRPRCGLILLRDLLGRIEAVQAERHPESDVLRERLEQITTQVERDTFIRSLLKRSDADSLGVVELTMELEESGVTIDDLKSANVQTLEDLKHCLDEHP